MSDTRIRTLEALSREGDEQATLALVREHERAGDRIALQRMAVWGVRAALDALVAAYTSEEDQAALCKLGYHKVTTPVLQCVDPMCGALDNGGDEPCNPNTWCLYCQAPACRSRMPVHWVETDIRPMVTTWLSGPGDPWDGDELTRRAANAWRR